MKEYITNQAITLFSGKIKLAKKQAARRLHALKKIKKDTYEILDKVMFKAGEIITLDPDKATKSKMELTKKDLQQAETGKELPTDPETKK